jgi:hypothetical protein
MLLLDFVGSPRRELGIGGVHVRPLNLSSDAHWIAEEVP